MKAELRFNHIALNVRDLGRSAAFYGGILGLPEIVNKTCNPKIRWFGFDGNREIHLISGPDVAPPERPIEAHFCLATPHFDATLEDLRAKGVRYCDVSGKPMTFNHRADGVRQTYFQDPDNFWVEICESDAQGAVG